MGGWEQIRGVAMGSWRGPDRDHEALFALRGIFGFPVRSWRIFETRGSCVISHNGDFPAIYFP
ncbi:hypothetical protein OK074_3313 [Actinobacteria bacterium OK074]|nr:hypothetical protein OK074_3313 [Actinobacteria bacterium OK074]